MKYFTQLMLVLFTFSACDNNNEKIATEPLNFITIGDKSYGVSLNGTYGNTNCSSIFAHLDYESTTDRGFRLAFTLNKYGAVSKVKLMMYQNMVTIYESADFNSSSTFKISNFIYKPEQNFLSFDFRG